MMQCFDSINDGTFTPLSPLFNYWFSRYILNGKAPTSDDGSTILAAMQALVNYGNAPELDWPITSPLEGKPSTKAQTDAKPYNVLKYFTIPESTVSDPTKNTEILSLKQLLYSNSPVMFGCDVHDSIMNVGSDGLEPYAPENSKTDPIDGGHARWLRGFNDSIVIPKAPIKGAFLVRNSWNGWGLNGDSWVSYQVFIDQETDDMGITSANYPSNNPTPPSPVPTPPGPSPQPDPTIYSIVMELDSALPLMKKSSSKYVKQAVVIVQDCITELSKLE